jgi:ABC-2 type transport system permease protein
MRGFANNQPLTPMVNAVRALTLGPEAQAVLSHTAGYYVVRSLLWSVALVVVSAPIAVARYRRG